MNKKITVDFWLHDSDFNDEGGVLACLLAEAMNRMLLEGTNGKLLRFKAWHNDDSSVVTCEGKND